MNTQYNIGILVSKRVVTAEIERTSGDVWINATASLKISLCSCTTQVRGTLSSEGCLSQSPMLLR